MRSFPFLAIVFLALIALGCEKQKSPALNFNTHKADDKSPAPWTIDAASLPTDSPTSPHRHFSFETETQGWSADAVGFSEEMRPAIGFFSGITPSPLGTNGYQLKSNNLTGTVFMFLRRHYSEKDGILAGRTYSVHARAKFVSSASSECADDSNSPGKMMLRLGVSARGLSQGLDEQGYLRIRPDPWLHPDSYSLIGSIANGRECDPSLADFARVVRETPNDLKVTSSSTGELDVIVGVGGGFTGTTDVWLESLDVVIELADGD